MQSLMTKESAPDMYQLDVMSVVEDRLAEYIGKIPECMMTVSNGELFKRANPTPIDYAIRNAFWREYDLYFLSGRTGKIKTADFCRGICTPSYLYSIASKSALLLWIIKPKQSYSREMESILSRGIERLWELIEIPIYNEKNKVDPRLAGIVLQAIKQVEDRVQGMAVQRTQSVSVNINEKLPSVGGDKSMDDINAKIKELEGAIHASGTPGRVIDHKALPSATKEFETVELRPIQKWDDSPSQYAAPEQEDGAQGPVPNPED